MTGSGDAGVCTEEQICVLCLEAVTLLLVGSAGNTGVFREAQGAKLMVSLLPYSRCRSLVMGK